MSDPVITFLSDYGHDDEFVGVCHGVIARVCPRARVIDITHGIPRHDVRAGALALAGALPYMPDAVHLAVVDPTVGARLAAAVGNVPRDATRAAAAVGNVPRDATRAAAAAGNVRRDATRAAAAAIPARRAVAVRAGPAGAILVGPDNGLLAPAIAWLGEPVAAVDLAASRHRLRPVSATFHGRDIFAPVAAALAGGEPLRSVGDPIPADGLAPLDLPHASLSADGALVAHALTVDTFGNVALDATPDQIAAAGIASGAMLSVRVAGRVRDARLGAAFADVEPGQLLLYRDARRMMALAINRGSAAEALALTVDAEVALAPAAQGGQA